ncbi:MAG TPA: cytochrome C oxidase subunit IV family protein [Bacteroidales bacterium]|nr:cytochrome C oxidase subunit IV family protein [Lentimicrobiaceae bacterium]HOH99721.1 cytochrome C oxidase subunit IV family protein [Bacteroidales bacterium]
MSEEKHHIVPFRNHFFVLLALLVLTVVTVAITWTNLGPYNTTTAMIIAGIKAAIVMTYFMHLRFDHKIYTIMVVLVLALFAAVLILTFLDYFYR